MNKKVKTNNQVLLPTNHRNDVRMFKTQMEVQVAGEWFFLQSFEHYDVISTINADG